MAQVARNVCMVFGEEPEEFRPTHIIRDRDRKFTEHFCSILESDGIEWRPIPPRSPNLNSYAEAWVQRTKHEVLNSAIHPFRNPHLRVASRQLDLRIKSYNITTFGRTIF